MAKILRYDPSQFAYISQFEGVFDVEPGQLMNLHVHRPELMPQAALDSITETRTGFHQHVYCALASEAGAALKRTYVDFLTARIAPLFDRAFLYQRFPTFRIQLPGEQAVHTWHCDSDEWHRHPPWELNFQIALTAMRGNCATWIESVPGLRDFAAMEMEVGEFAVFDGNRCLHGNRTNDSDHCRLSLDFRVLPRDRYDPQRAGSSLTSAMKFVIGEYYALHQA